MLVEISLTAKPQQALNGTSVIEQDKADLFPFCSFLNPPVCIHLGVASGVGLNDSHAHEIM